MNKGILALVVIAAVLIFAGFFLKLSNNESDTALKAHFWRYRITVSIDTPEGLKSGSAVREVRYQKGWHITPEMLPNIDYSGEAVVVDLGSRGVLFALTGRDSAADLIGKLFPGPHKKGKITLTPGQYVEYAPAVAFKEMSDAKTVFAVDYRKLSQIFGEGVSIKEITIEITDDSISTGIVLQYLPWLKGMNGYLSGKHVNGEKMYEWLDSGDFIR